MLSPPECFEQGGEADNDASDAPHHTLGLPDALSHDGPVAVTKLVVTNLFQLHPQRTSSRSHGMSSIGTGCLAGVTPPDLPGIVLVAAEERGASNNQERGQPGWKQV